MKITGTKTQIVELPADEPLAGAAENPNGKRPIICLRMQTDAGIEGIGVSYFGGALTRTLAHAIDELGALCVGDDPVLVEGMQAKLKNAAGGSAGPGGVYHLALSAIDLLTTPKVLAEAKAEFDKSLTGREYRSLHPKEVRLR